MSTVGTVAVTPGRPGEEDYGPCREEVQLYLPLVVMVGGCFPDSPRARKASFSNDVLRGVLATKHPWTVGLSFLFLGGG